MSGNDKKNLTEVDKMINRLDDIKTSLKGEEDENLNDDFESLRFGIRKELKTIETLLIDREKILNSKVPKEIYERKKIEYKLEEKFDKVEDMMKKLKIELKMIKYMNGKGEDFIKKEKYVNLIEQLYQLHRDEFDGEEIDDNQIKENKKKIEELKKLIEDEELTEEEKAKLEEWRKEIAKEEEDLGEILDIVRQIKEESKSPKENFIYKEIIY